MSAKLQRFILVFLIVLAGKLIYLKLNSVTIDTDSHLYLTCIFHFDYPFLYPYFLYVLKGIQESLVFVTVCQIVLIAAAVAFVASQAITNKKGTWVFGLLFAIEPVSSMLSTTIVSEALFLPLLFALTGFLYFEHKISTAVLIGFTCGLLYLTRFAGAFFLLLYPLVLWMSKSDSLRSRLNLLLLYSITFFLTLLPIKVRYHDLFGTHKLNAVTNESIWNNATVLIPEYRKHTSASNDFERYVYSVSDSLYTTGHAIHATHIDSLGMPFHAYRQHAARNFNDLPADARIAAETGWKLILSNPAGYLKMFVLPNILRVFVENDHTVLNKTLRRSYSNNISLAKWNHTFTIIAVMLALTSMIVLLSHGEKNSVLKALVIVSVVYCFVLPFVSPMVVRYYMITIPISMLVIFTISSGRTHSSDQL